MTTEEYRKMIKENEDRMEEFIRSVPMQEFFSVVKSKLKLEDISFNITYNSGANRRYGTVCDTSIDFTSDNIADTNPIFKLAFSEVILTPFGDGRVSILSNNQHITARNFETFEYTDKPEIKFYTNLYLFHKSHSGGENGDSLCEATYTERDGWDIRWGNDVIS